jgi:hypothetical protein
MATTTKYACGLPTFWTIPDSDDRTVSMRMPKVFHCCILPKVSSRSRLDSPVPSRMLGKAFFGQRIVGQSLFACGKSLERNWHSIKPLKKWSLRAILKP